MVWVIAFSSPDNFVINPKVYAIKFNPTYKPFGTVTTPAAGTKSMGLPAELLSVMVFAVPSRPFYRDETTPARLLGLEKITPAAS
jgi:hypothetical protein